MQKVNIIKKLAQFNDYWQPRIVAELNEQYVKVAKFKGEFPWHKHENEDELFFVVKGEFTLEFRDKKVKVSENEFIVVPRNVEHRSIAEEEVEVMLFEPKTTLNTGSSLNEYTKKNLDKI